jgi:predicted ribosome quality control (RQC) complex YloA/Tae2 family protein
MKSLEAEAMRAAQAESMGQWATLVTSNLYRIPENATTFTVEDWESDGAPTTLKFNRAKFLSPRHEAEAAFVTARRLRRGTATIAGLIAGFFLNSFSGPTPLAVFACVTIKTFSVPSHF